MTPVPPGGARPEDRSAMTRTARATISPMVSTASSDSAFFTRPLGARQVPQQSLQKLRSRSFGGTWNALQPDRSDSEGARNRLVAARALRRWPPLRRRRG
jgi:hypothetical protein